MNALGGKPRGKEICYLFVCWRDLKFLGITLGRGLSRNFAIFDLRI